MANKIYKGQKQVQFKLKTGVDFDTYTYVSSKIKYVKPDKSTGEWTSAKLVGSEIDGVIYIDFDDTNYFDQAGIWRFWAEVTFSGARIGLGRAVEYLVKTEGAKK